MSISYCTVRPSFWRSKNSVSPSLTSIVWQSAALGRHLPSPVAATSEETRNTAVLASLSTPRNTKKGLLADGSGDRRARSRIVRRLPAEPKRSVRRNVSRLSGFVPDGGRGSVGVEPLPAGVSPPELLEPLGVDPAPAGVAPGVVSVPPAALG